MMWDDRISSVMVVGSSVCNHRMTLRVLRSPAVIFLGLDIFCCFCFFVEADDEEKDEQKEDEAEEEREEDPAWCVIFAFDDFCRCLFSYFAALSVPCLAIAPSNSPLSIASK